MSPSRKSVSAVVGLDIGADSIKVAEAKVAKDGITITNLGIAKTPEGVIDNEMVVDPTALGKAVKSLLAESGIKTKKCVSSVSGQSNVVVRVIEVPKMKPDELAETMRWEIERHVPFAIQEVEYDFHALDKPGADPDAPEMEVLLAVARQDLVNGHVQALFAAGLQPMAIDIEPLAASRALIETSSNGARSEIVAIVNIGSRSTDVGIFESGLLTFPSPPIAIAGDNLTQEIAAALGQTLDQAEIMKKEYAVADLALIESMTQQPEPVQQPEPEPEPEPTQFNTVFSQSPAEPAAPAADEAPGSPGYGAFTETVDGPVFDIGGDQPAGGAPSGPAFDLGEPAASSGPAFDLGDTSSAAPSDGPASDSGEPGASAPSGPAFDLGEPAAASTGPAFDLGGAGAAEPEPAADSGPVFDLGGEETPAEASAPDFDLDDVSPAQSEPQAPGVAFDLGDLSAQPTQAGADAQSAASLPAGDMGSTQDQVSQAVANVLIELATDIRRSLEYFATMHSKTPTRVFLCGGTAKMPKLGEFLSRELGIPVEVADPLKNLRVNCPSASPQYLNEISPLFSVSIGLAIRDMID